MNKTLTTKSFNNRIVILLMILGLSVFFILGCSVSFSTNNNAANTNLAANKTTVSNNANSSTPAPVNTNVNANTTATNSDSAKPEPKANTNVASKTDDSANTEKSDCTVKEDNADFFIEATEKTIKLKKGTLVNVVSWDMHQGLYAVNAKIDGKWVRGEINYELIDCPEDGKDAPVKK